MKADFLSVHATSVASSVSECCEEFRINYIRATKHCCGPRQKGQTI